MKMFAAFVIIMLATGPVRIADTRGPYETLAECKDRTYEMGAYATSVRLRAVSGYCKSIFVRTA